MTTVNKTDEEVMGIDFALKLFCFPWKHVYDYKVDKFNLSGWRKDFLRCSLMHGYIVGLFLDDAPASTGERLTPRRARQRPTE